MAFITGSRNVRSNDNTPSNPSPFGSMPLFRITPPLCDLPCVARKIIFWEFNRQLDEIVCVLYGVKLADIAALTEITK
jgi:hypothetical protein